MPLVEYSLRAVKHALAQVDADPNRVGRVLTLAYPDVIVPRDKLVDIFGACCIRLPARPDSAKTIAWHKAEGLVTDVPDTEALFKVLGYEMDCVDVHEARGGEILHDLSTPLPDVLHNKYDLVFDCITHQCFNIAQAWGNMVRAVRRDGFVVSVTPAVMVNNGFWNISPTAYHDFFAANGVSTVSLSWQQGSYVGTKADLHPTGRCKAVLDSTMNVFVGRKFHDYATPHWPIMTKFKKFPNSHRT